MVGKIILPTIDSILYSVIDKSYFRRSKVKHFIEISSISNWGNRNL